MALQNHAQFDRSFLPPADFEFVVVADTHYMLDMGDRPLEFESRRKQTARAEYALRRIAALDVPLVIHMGDLVQEYPETEKFAQAVSEARAQLERFGVQPRRVAGNHDVGDKHDPTMPAQPVTAEFLANYHADWGPSWFSWDQGGLHFIVLNSQIMNSDLPAATAQGAWLEAELREHSHKRIVLCLHLPPFLKDEREPALGHYDNIDEPARSWLLELVKQHNVELMFAAHIHWSFYNEVGPSETGRTRYHTTPSTSFTRPGFSQMFSSAPPPEQGRDDTGKLGFFLVRVQGEESRVHLVRTSGATDSADDAAGAQLLTRLTSDLPGSPLGAMLHHALAPAVETPSVWPSVIRQPVRNDYPLLNCLELGVRHLRVPATDLTDPLQAERLAILRRYGVQITATWLWRETLDLVDAVAQHGEQLDTVEVIVPGALQPPAACLRQIAACQSQHEVGVALSPVLPGRSVAGKQHPRFQRGYGPDELAELDRLLAQHDLQVARALCRLDADEPASALLSPAQEFTHIGAVDWIWELPKADVQTRINCAAAALFAVASRPGSRLFIEPLVDLDRTMDSMGGLLDRLCNPRPVFHALRRLNTLLFGEAQSWYTLGTMDVSGGRVLALRGDAQQRWLVLPADAKAGCVVRAADLGETEAQPRRCCGLLTGVIQSWSAAAEHHLTEPSVIL
jgi:hypothetical protein